MSVGFVGGDVDLTTTRNQELALEQRHKYTSRTDNNAVDFPIVNGTQTPTPSAASRTNIIKAACYSNQTG